MRLLTLALVVLGGLGAAAPARAETPALRLEGGFVALQNGTTTRVPAIAAGASARWMLSGPWFASAGYRGALRLTGNSYARVLTLVNDVPLSAGALYQGELARIGLAASLLPQLETTRLSGPGRPPATITTAAVGVGGELELGLRAGARTTASVIITASTRRYYLDYGLLCVLEWR